MDEKYYLSRLEDANKNLDIYQTKFSRISNLRLIFFALFLGSFIIFIFSNNVFYLLTAVIFLGIFIMLIFIHNNISSKVTYYKLLMETLAEYIYRFDRRWMNFSETGNEFNNNKLSFLQDLDIIGDASLFKYLNICATKNGKQKLIDRLSNNYITKDELIAKQKSLHEISRNIDFSLDFQVALKNYNNEGSSTNLNYITNILKTKIEFSKSNIYTATLFTIITFITSFLAIIDKISWIYFLIVFINQFVFSSIIHYKYKDVFQKISNLFLTIIMLEKVYKVITNQKFNDEVLCKLQDDISNYGLIGIKEINKIKNLKSYTKFFLTNIIFNGLFSIDVLIIYLFKRFIDNYGVTFFKSVEALEEFEVNTSLAILGQTKQNITLPTLTEEMKINFNDLKHPLIPESECVSNSFTQATNINIITGSNMSGKTSFLKTIGINIILMNAGAYCTASSFSSPYLKIFTSMRIVDDISKGISTFYAELLRIKSAIDYSKENKPMIIFIDEIFKGTNSNDRITGAISLIERLNKHHIIIFISTHDFELCEIKSVELSNYHFSEYYEGNKIKFDYKLKQGKCVTTNAKYLMKIAGIID